jgi:hypothetical protein
MNMTAGANRGTVTSASSTLPKRVFTHSSSGFKKLRRPISHLNRKSNSVREVSGGLAGSLQSTVCVASHGFDLSHCQLNRSFSWNLHPSYMEL